MAGTWIEAANYEPTLIERMRALLGMDDGISFAELDQLDGFHGDQALLDGDGDTNRVLWPWVSEEAAAALALLIAGGECHLAGAGLLTYVCDGRVRACRSRAAADPTCGRAGCRQCCGAASRKLIVRPASRRDGRSLAGRRRRRGSAA